MPRRLSSLLAVAVGVLGSAEVARAQPGYAVLYPFVAGEDGQLPRASLIQATDGNFYGTTLYGGGKPDSCAFAFGCGTVFRMTPEGTVTVVHAFAGGTDGAIPYATLIQATDGNLYGTTQYGGDTTCFAGCGTVFRMTLDGTVTILHAFTGGLDGEKPVAALVQAVDGNFYGTTLNGGGSPTCSSGCGTVFQMSADGLVTILHAFIGGTDGATPWAALIQTTEGNFYGTTQFGGGSPSCAAGCGTAFRMSPDGTLTILHRFSGGTEDGKFPAAAFLMGTDLDFYSTTYAGGSAEDVGTAFRMSSDGNVTILHRFNGADGANPEAALIQGTDGNFYGTTGLGGNSGCNGSGCGVVFQMTADGTVTILHPFAGGPDDGWHPVNALIQATDAQLYGTTAAGGPPGCGSNGCGTVFRLTLAR